MQLSTCDQEGKYKFSNERVLLLNYDQDMAHNTLGAIASSLLACSIATVVCSDMLSTLGVVFLCSELLFGGVFLSIP